MERIAIFPGSFDPFTLGHESIVKHALELAIEQDEDAAMRYIEEARMASI